MRESGKLTLYDYLAASMITIAAVWLWAQASINIPQFFERAPVSLVTASSYGFYILGSTAASYLVLYKTGNREIITGFKVGATCFILSGFYYSLYLGVQMNLLTAMFISFPIGGFLGAYVRIQQDKRRIERSDVDAKSTEEVTGS